MAINENTESKDVSSVDIAVIICLLICLAILVSFFTSQTPVSDEAFGFQSQEIDAERLAKERKERLGDKTFDLKDSRIQELLSVVHTANAEQFSTILSDTDRIRRQAERVYRANEVMELGWFPAFWTVGEIVINECTDELKKVITELQKGAKEDSFRTAKEYIDYRESCGDLLPMLFEFNILTKRGQWVDKNGPMVVDVSLRYAWGFILNERKHASSQLTPHEYEFYETWRIGNEKAFTRKQRLKFLRRAKSKNNGFPASLMMAKMQFQDGKFKSALKLLEEAEKETPANPEIGRMKRYLAKKLKTH